MKRFIAQTGLGDAVFALPLAMACEAEKIEAEFYTGWPELLTGLNYVKGFKVPPWDSEENRKFEGTRLKYDRYRGSYFDSYYAAHGMETDLVEAQEMAQHWLTHSADAFDIPRTLYVVAGAPRYPARHKVKAIAGDEGSFLHYESEILNAKREGYFVANVGCDEIYTAPLMGDIDFTDRLTREQLIYLVSNAKYVISQIGFLTALAGCLGTYMKYIQGADEPNERFLRHVEGVTWKKNLRC